jgi:hypothetical protein
MKHLTLIGFMVVFLGIPLWAVYQQSLHLNTCLRCDTNVASGVQEDQGCGACFAGTDPCEVCRGLKGVDPHRCPIPYLTEDDVLKERYGEAIINTLHGAWRLTWAEIRWEEKHEKH